MFLSAKCPCSISHEETLKDLAQEFKDFAFVGVHSNVDEDPEMAQKHFAEAKLPFKVIEDSQAKLANLYKANKTPHAFVVSPKGEILYRGGVTDSKNAGMARTYFLKEALTDIQNGRAVRRSEGRTLGCTISRGEKFVW